MINVNEKVVLSVMRYIGGALAGGGLTILSLSVIDYIRYCKQAEEELLKIEADLDKKYGKEDPAVYNEEVVAEQLIRNYDGTAIEDIVVTNEKNPISKLLDMQPVDYSGIAKKSVEAGNDMKAAVNEVAEKFLASTPETEVKYPYPITDVVFKNSVGWDNETWTYYEVDKVLVDQQEKIVAEPEKMLWADFVKNFGEISGDKDVLYARDPMCMTDYEIVRVHGSYSEIVLGVSDKVKIKQSRRSSTGAGARSKKNGDAGN
jgi:hypothetical protein